VGEVDCSVTVRRCAGGSVSFDLFGRHLLPIRIRQQLGELFDRQPIWVGGLRFVFHEGLIGRDRDTANTPATVARKCMFGVVGRMLGPATLGQNRPRVAMKRKLKITETLLPELS
jgi:hypothetical protein